MRVSNKAPGVLSSSRVPTDATDPIESESDTENPQQLVYLKEHSDHFLIAPPLSED